MESYKDEALNVKRFLENIDPSLNGSKQGLQGQDSDEDVNNSNDVNDHPQPPTVKELDAVEWRMRQEWKRIKKAREDGRLDLLNDAIKRYMKLKETRDGYRKTIFTPLVVNPGLLGEPLPTNLHAPKTPLTDMPEFPSRPFWGDPENTIDNGNFPEQLPVPTIEKPESYVVDPPSDQLVGAKIPRALPHELTPVPIDWVSQ